MTNLERFTSEHDMTPERITRIAYSAAHRLTRNRSIDQAYDVDDFASEAVVAVLMLTRVLSDQEEPLADEAWKIFYNEARRGAYNLARRLWRRAKQLPRVPLENEEGELHEDVEAHTAYYPHDSLTFADEVVFLLNDVELSDGQARAIKSRLSGMTDREAVTEGLFKTTDSHNQAHWRAVKKIRKHHGITAVSQRGVEIK